MKRLISNIGKHISRKQAFVEVFFQEESTSFNVIVTSLKKNQLTIEKKLVNLKNTDELISQIPVAIPLHLILTGYGIISRVVEIRKDNQSADENYLLSTFPNINTEDVHYSFIKSEHVGLIGVIKKTKLDTFLKEFSTEVNIASISIGQFAIHKLGDYINEETFIIQHRDIEYHFERNELIKTQETKVTNEETLNIGDERIEPEILIPYCLALNHYDNDDNYLIDKDLKKKNEGSFEEYVYGRLYGFLWKGSLAIILIVLLVNYFVFDHVMDKNNQLSQKISIVENNNKTIAEDNQKTTELNQMLSEYGFLNQTMYSIYTDHLSNELTDKIYFTSVEFHPLLKSKSKNIINFEKNKIVVNGYSNDNNELNNYIQRLDEKEWIDFINIVSIENKKGSNTLLFQIEIFTFIG